MQQPRRAGRTRTTTGGSTVQPNARPRRVAPQPARPFALGCKGIEERAEQRLSRGGHAIVNPFLAPLALEQPAPPNHLEMARQTGLGIRRMSASSHTHNASLPQEHENAQPRLVSQGMGKSNRDFIVIYRNDKSRCVKVRRRRGLVDNEGSVKFIPRPVEFT